MQDYNDTDEREHCLEESIKELSKINNQLTKLLFRKEILTNLIIGALGHEHEGQKSYDHGLWKIEIRTPFIYSLNKKLYESGEIKLPDNFNPIKQSISYIIDKRLLDKYIQEAPIDIRNAIVELIDKKPGKAAVIIKGRLS